MARILQDGFDQAIPEKVSGTVYPYAGRSNWAASISHYGGEDRGRIYPTPSYAFDPPNVNDCGLLFERTTSDNDLTFQVCLYQYIPTPRDILFSRFMFYCAGGYSQRSIFAFDDGNSLLDASSMQLKYSGNSDLLELYVDDVMVASVVGAIYPGVWALVEVKYDAVAGQIVVKVDGGIVIDYSGVIDTDITTVIIGNNDSNTRAYSDAIFRQAIDHLAVNDDTGSVNNSWIGGGIITILRPTADGTNSAFTPLGGGDNYVEVDDVWNDYDTSYNESSALNDIDSFTIESVPTVSTSQSINAVKVCAMGKASEYAASMATYFKSGTTESVGGENKLFLNSYVNQVETIYDTDPNTSAQWTEANVNASEVGYKHIASV